MIPYTYNMVDMGGIDMAEANHTVVEGIFSKIEDALDDTKVLVLYNMYFAEIRIPPAYCNVEVEGGSILINGCIEVSANDEVTVIGVPPPIEPVIPLSVDDNGVYTVSPPQSGYNPVTVALQFTELAVTENDVYTPESPSRGFSKVTVNVPQPEPVIEQLSVSENGTYTAPTGVDGYSPVVVDVDSMTAQVYDPTYDPSVVSSILGNITKVGPFVTCQLRVNLVSSRNLNGLKLFTLPSAVIPSGYFLFRGIGNGGTGSTVKGYINSNDGGFYIDGSMTTSYVYLTASWFVGEVVQITPIAEDISITGGLSVYGDIADLHAKVVVSGSSAWKDLFSVPSGYVSGLNPPYLLSESTPYDSTVSEAGVVSAWLSSGTRTFTVEKTWKFN